MRILCGASAILLLGLSGCIAANPDYCDPAAGAVCPTSGEGDLAAPPGDDLRGANPADLRGADPPDLSPACAEDSDCASRVCLEGGTCATDVVYGNNRGGLCSGSHAGTLGDPVCGTAEALALSRRTGRRHVYLFPSSVAYDAVDLTGLSLLSIRGPGGFAAATARIEAQGAAPAVIVRAGSLLLDGLELVGAGDAVVFCQADSGGAPQLEVRRSRIRDGQASGIYGQGCRLTVRRSALYLNGNSAVNAEGGGEVLVENSFLLYNRGGGVRLSGLGGRIRFSTLVYNGVVGVSGGAVECSTSGGQKLVEGSIVVGNGRGAGGSQLTSACRLQRSALGEDSFVNGSENRFRAAPDFVSNEDFRLRRGAGSSACCIDQLSAAAGTSDVLGDFDGTGRPQGPRWDIGAHEVK